MRDLLAPRKKQVLQCNDSCSSEMERKSSINANQNHLPGITNPGTYN